MSLKSLSKSSLILFACYTLIACEQGTTTVANPFSDTSSTANSGPPAATDDVRKFEVNVWNNLKADNRCGQCHSSDGNNQAPFFAETSDVNVAYSAAISFVDLQTPSNSILVTKVGTGHNCWEAVDSVCADNIKNMINSWSGATSTTTFREITLTAPEIKDPGDTKTFPDLATDGSPDSYSETVHPLVEQYCIACHYQEGTSQQQSPFFANPDPESSYQAAKAKINIDLPSNSSLVQRLAGNHNCWSDCTANALEMQTAIEQFANGISTTNIDPSLVTSKALTLLDGVIASGGNRHEANLIALWEFKVRTGLTAFDTSGIEPAVNLDLIGNVAWLDSYGLDFTGGRAQADTTASKKLHDFIKSSGEYSIEAWVIPGNVSQEDANIISYDAGSTQKNFTLSQTLYDYNFHNRSDSSNANGEPVLSTPDADEVLQASLQHVVATYDPVSGRQIYVNGTLINVTEPIANSTSISNWDDTFAFVLGENAAGSQTWIGQVRQVAIHNRVLTAEQVTQNYDVGVGQKYFLLFSIAEHTGIDDSYIRFEVSQFDSYAYLFQNPTLINLDSSWVPGGFNIKNMRIGINGKEATSGQSFANLDVTIDSSYTPEEGQNLSTLGAVIALEKGSDSDEFFLTFELLASESNNFDDPAGVAAPDPADADAVSDIGIRTFDEINATIAKITNIPITNSAISALYTQYQQQLPNIEDINAFLPAHQMAIAQIALTSCSERVDIDKTLPIGDSDRLFTDFDFSESSGTAFDSATKINNAVDPLLAAVFNSNVTSQPDNTDIKDLLSASGIQTLVSGSNSYNYSSLIETMNTSDTVLRTEQIIKSMCAATVGSAAMLIQ